MRIESRKMMMIESRIIPPRIGKVLPSPGVRDWIVTPWERWVGGRVYKVKREGAVGRVESVEAYHGGGGEKSQDRRRAAASLKRDGRMTMARGLYRKRGGGVVAAGNDLDRQAFTGIVKETRV
jgi:hypothetical protein